MSNSRINRKLFQQIYRDPNSRPVSPASTQLLEEKSKIFQFTWNLDELPQVTERVPLMDFTKSRSIQNTHASFSPAKWEILTSQETPDYYARLPKLKAKRRSPEPSSRMTLSKRLSLKKKPEVAAQPENVSVDAILMPPPSRRPCTITRTLPSMEEKPTNWALELLCEKSKFLEITSAPHSKCLQQRYICEKVLCTSECPRSPIKRKLRVSEPLPKRRSSLINTRMTDYFAIRRNPFQSSTKRVA